MGLNVPFGVPVELLDEERDGVRAPELAAGDGDAPLGESIRYAVVARQGGSTEPQSKNRDIDGGKLPFKQQCRTAVARRKAYHGVTCRGETRPGVRVGDPCVVVLFLYLSGVEAPSRNVALSVLAMSAGTVISSFGEAHFNLTGFLIMCAAETSEATRLVLTQRLLCNLKFGAFEGLYLMAPICAAWMWGLALFLEVPKLRASGDFAKVAENGDVFLIAALLGFAVNVASFLVIKRTSSVMVKLLGTARNAGLVLLSALALGEEVTAQQALGYGICLAFFAAYNYFKLTEKKESAKPPGSPLPGGKRGAAAPAAAELTLRGGRSSLDLEADADATEGLLDDGAGPSPR